jgi:hypothetical protein
MSPTLSDGLNCGNAVFNACCVDAIFDMPPPPIMPRPPVIPPGESAMERLVSMRNRTTAPSPF